MAVISTTTTASRRSLTTIERYREMMPATEAADAKLETLIGQATNAIERHLGRIVARERVTELLRQAPDDVYLVLERKPVTTIHGITVDGAAFASTHYSLDGPAAGTVRLVSGPNALWDELIGYGPSGGDYGYRSGPPSTVRYEVDYTAGWLVPDATEGARDLPADLEMACQVMVRAMLEQQERQLGLSAERLGDASWTYNAGKTSADLIDPVRGILDRYRSVVL